MSKMFQIEGKRVETWNPLGGKCSHECGYCWSRILIAQKGWKKYEGAPRLWRQWRKSFEAGSTVFVQSMTDLFARDVDSKLIQLILDHCERFPDTTFLLLTKNPFRYLSFFIPENCVCGCTLETNRENNLYRAPKRERRVWRMVKLQKRKFLSIEPIMDFDAKGFVIIIKRIGPEFVYIGYDNYDCGLPEPPIEKTHQLIEDITPFTEVRLKTMRTS